MKARQSPEGPVSSYIMSMDQVRLNGLDDLPQLTGRREVTKRRVPPGPKLVEENFRRDALRILKGDEMYLITFLVKMVYPFGSVATGRVRQKAEFDLP